MHTDQRNGRVWDRLRVIKTVDDVSASLRYMDQDSLFYASTYATCKTRTLFLSTVSGVGVRRGTVS